MREITILGIACPRCYDEIHSRHRHDMRYCSCGYCYIDGGREYTRIGWGDPETGSILYGEPIYVEITLPDQRDIENN